MTGFEALRFVLWANALGRGSVSLDQGHAEILSQDVAHDVVVWDALESTPLILELPSLARCGPWTAALPVPGHPVGLAGPADFNAAATAIGQAALCAQGGLLPHRAGPGVVWQSATAQRAWVLDPREEGRMLRQELLNAARVLAELDVAAWNADAADALRSAIEAGSSGLVLPADLPVRLVEPAHSALWCLEVAEVVLDTPEGRLGGPRTGAEAERLRRVVSELAQAARRALIAVCSYDPRH